MSKAKKEKVFIDDLLKIFSIVSLSFVVSGPVFKGGLKKENFCVVVDSSFSTSYVNNYYDRVKNFVLRFSRYALERGLSFKIIDTSNPSYEHYVYNYVNIYRFLDRLKPYYKDVPSELSISFCNKEDTVIFISDGDSKDIKRVLESGNNVFFYIIQSKIDYPNAYIKSFGYEDVLYYPDRILRYYLLFKSNKRLHITINSNDGKKEVWIDKKGKRLYFSIRDRGFIRISGDSFDGDNVFKIRVKAPFSIKGIFLDNYPVLGEYLKKAFSLFSLSSSKSYPIKVSFRGDGDINFLVRNLKERQCLKCKNVIFPQRNPLKVLGSGFFLNFIGRYRRYKDSPADRVLLTCDYNSIVYWKNKRLFVDFPIMCNDFIKSKEFIPFLGQIIHLFLKEKGVFRIYTHYPPFDEVMPEYYGGSLKRFIFPREILLEKIFRYFLIGVFMISVAMEGFLVWGRRSF